MPAHLKGVLSFLFIQMFFNKFYTRCIHIFRNLHPTSGHQENLYIIDKLQVSKTFNQTPT